MKIAFVVLVFAFITSSCRKDDTGHVFTLPAKTQLGLHTFGFLLDGNVWTNYRQHCTTFGCADNLVGHFYKSDGDISVTADRVLFNNNNLDSDESFGWTTQTNFAGVGTYSTTANDTISVGYVITYPGQTTVYYGLPLANPVFSITYTKIDTANKILAGEFSGKLFRRDMAMPGATLTTDSIIISEGRFDIKMK